MFRCVCPGSWHIEPRVLLLRENEAEGECGAVPQSADGPVAATLNFIAARAWALSAQHGCLVEPVCGGVKGEGQRRVRRRQDRKGQIGLTLRP